MEVRGKIVHMEARIGHPIQMLLIAEHALLPQTTSRLKKTTEKYTESLLCRE